MFMTRFAVGEQVTIRFGKHQGQKAKIVKSQTADAYRVRIENGFVLCYTWKGLAKEKEGAQKVV
jgi:hypothetical protein